MAAARSTHGYEVLLETGGHMPIDDVPDEVVAIVDVKCPGSGEAGNGCTGRISTSCRRTTR